MTEDKVMEMNQNKVNNIDWADVWGNNSSNNNQVSNNTSSTNQSSNNMFNFPDSKKTVSPITTNKSPFNFNIIEESTTQNNNVVPQQRGSFNNNNNPVLSPNNVPQQRGSFNNNNNPIIGSNSPNMKQNQNVFNFNPQGNSRLPNNYSITKKDDPLDSLLDNLSTPNQTQNQVSLIFHLAYDELYGFTKSNDAAKTSDDAKPKYEPTNDSVYDDATTDDDE